MKIESCLRSLLVSASLISCTLPAFADQVVGSAVKVTSGTIVGVIKNSAKAAVAGATVIATGVESGSIRATVSSSDGIYSFADLAPGTYAVTAQVDGHPDVALPPVTVTAGKATRSDIVMNVPSEVSSPLAPALASAHAPAATPAPAAPAETPAPRTSGSVTSLTAAL